ncbi:MAG: ribonuclease P protein component [Desulfarculus sp.]|nr:ribonuclease P protein component [Desulfarculus sp.]
MGRERRLRQRGQFLALQRARRVNQRQILFLWRPNGLAFSRLGLTVSRRVGGAVVRNRIKRRLREIFRRAGADLPRGIDLVAVARPEAAGLDFAALHRLTHQALEAIARELTRNYHHSA